MMSTSTNEQFVDGEVHNVKSNILQGTIGALLGAALGGALWVVIYSFGYIASIAGIAIIFCAYKGYTLFSKRKGKIPAIIATTVSVLMLFIAHYFAWGVVIYLEVSNTYDITLWDALLSVHEFIFDPELMFDFFKDLIIGIILIIVGFFYYVRQDTRKIPNPAAAENVETENIDTPAL